MGHGSDAVACRLRRQWVQRQSSAKLPATPHKVEIENSQVRVLRVLLQPRESTRIASPFIAVGIPSGQTHFHEGNTTIENKSIQTTEWIVVELK